LVFIIRPKQIVAVVIAPEIRAAQNATIQHLLSDIEALAKLEAEKAAAAAPVQKGEERGSRGR
jgi:hypothetical protein